MENALYRFGVRRAVYSFIRTRVSRWTIRARADDNCAKSFGQAQQQMVIDKAINHSFRSRELYWPLQALRVVLINVKPDVNVTAEAPRRHNSFLRTETRCTRCFNDNDEPTHKRGGTLISRVIPIVRWFTFTDQPELASDIFRSRQSGLSFSGKDFIALFPSINSF